MKRSVVSLLLALVLIAAAVVPAQASTEYRTWLQSDSRWGSIAFGNAGDTVAKSGCAVTSVAKLMVHSGSVSSDPAVFNPGIFVNFLKKNGGFTSQGWLVWSAINKYTSKFSYVGAAGLSGTKEQITASVKSYINKGYVVSVLVKDGGHYVAVDRVADNTVYIMDPAATGYTELFQYAVSGIQKLYYFKGVHTGTSSEPTYNTTVDPVGVGEYTITSSDGVNLRSGADTTYDKLTAIPYNTVVKVTKVSNNWGYTSYNGKNGWFSLQYAKLTNTLRGVQISPPAKTTYKIGESLSTTGLKVTALYADGTSKALTSGYTITGFSSAKAGTCKVYVTYQSRSAVFTVTISGQTYLPGLYTITSDNGVNLRSTASTEGTVLCALPKDTTVTVSEVKGNWGKAGYQDKAGWLCLDYAKYLSPVPVTQTGLSVTPVKAKFLGGETLDAFCLTVCRVYSDKSTQPLTDYELKVSVEENTVTFTVTDGEFTQSATAAYYATVPMGDCNFDGKVDAADALGVLRYAVGKNGIGVFYCEAADVNGDERIDASDALWILKAAVGKIKI